MRCDGIAVAAPLAGEWIGVQQATAVERTFQPARPSTPAFPRQIRKRFPDDHSHQLSFNGTYSLGGFVRDRKFTIWVTSTLIALIIFLGFPLALIADSAQPGYPAHTNDYVNDFAKVLRPADRDNIEAIFKRLEYETGIEAVAVTIDSIADYGTPDNNIESFATHLFNNWGIGHKKSNDGVLFLISVRDRKVRIELGGSYGHRYDDRMKSIIDDVVLPKFKADELSQGTFLGARAIVKEITIPVSWTEFYKWHLIIGGGIGALILSGIFFERKGQRGLVWLCFGGVFYLLFLLISMLISGKSQSGFGGGSSGGGGATGSW